MFKMNLFILQSILGIAIVSLLQADSALMETNRIVIDYDFTGKPLPKWQGGVLLAIDSTAGSAVRLNVFDKTGAKIQDQVFQIKGSKYLTVHDFARTSDGTLGLCGSAVDIEGRSGSYIAFIDPNTSSVTLIRSGEFKPMKMTFSSSETFWVVGYEINPLAAGEKPRSTLMQAVKKDAALFRQFDKSGKLLLSSVPHTSIDDPHVVTLPNNVFAEIGNEIIWYSGTARQLIIISGDGSFREVRDLNLPEDQMQTGFGITARGELIVSTIGKASWSVLKLMPTRREWQSLILGARADRGNRPILVVGVEGNLITALGGGDSGLRTFQMVN